jgi:CPA1 family monovalent cation:H+ antiporter
MEPFEHALLVLLAIAGLSVVSGFLPLPRPIIYVLGGIGLAFVPGFPVIELDPGFFFLCFLPPLLFSDGWLMPLREFGQVRWAVILLATGLVVLTTVVTAVVAHALVPGLPWPMAFALGAVISPTDAVAVDAITTRLRLPRRMAAVLKGESLLNDATGLVAFKFAVGAVAAAGAFSLRGAVVEFVLISVGGLAVGLVVSFAVGRVRDLLRKARRDDPLIEITLSLLTPYAAYLCGEAAHVSGILSIVAAGLYSGWWDPIRMSAETRQLTWSVWMAVLFWLNGFVFVMLGLQFPQLISGVVGQFSWGQLIGYALAISAVAAAVRVAWFFPGAYLSFYLSRRLRQTGPRPSWRRVLVASWAGVRGAVTLAAALSIPTVLADGSQFPGRSVVIFLSFGVIATTLLAQGATAGTLIRWLGLGSDGEEEQEELMARTAAVRAGLGALRELAPQLTRAEHTSALGHVVAEYEQRLAELVDEGPGRANAHERRVGERRFRLAALEAERHALDELWTSRRISDEVHRPLQHLLDHEETMLRGARSVPE